jgi:excisionase family DNA binding protein
LTGLAAQCHKACTGRTSEIWQHRLGCTSGLQFWACVGRRGSVPVNESREVMNVRQASQYLGISPDTLYRYITEGEIPAFKLGNRWKLRKTILDRWMERKMSQAHVRRR